MADPYMDFAKTPSSLGTVGRVITPGNDDLSPVPKAVVCLSAGSLTIVPVGNADEETLEFDNVAPGYIPPFRVRRLVAATATVATIEG